MSALRLSVLLAIAACGVGEGDPKVDPPGTPPGTDPVTVDPTSTVPTTPELGVPVVAPADLPVRVDAIDVRCDGATARVFVDVIGPADRLELDLIAAEAHAVAMAPVSTDPDTVWRRFEGEVSCALAEGSTRVLRASRAGELLDCSVVGPARDEALAGQFDERLQAAGRPGAASCHAL